VVVVYLVSLVILGLVTAWPHSWTEIE